MFTDGTWLQLAVLAVTAVVAVVAMFGGWKALRLKIDTFFDYLAMKTGIGLLSQVDEILVGYVTEVYQSQIKLLKAEDRWTAETAAKMKRQVIESTKAHFSFASLGKLAGPGSINDFLSGRTEAAVKEAKRRAVAAKADPSAA